jgi:hypothetical protein
MGHDWRPPITAFSARGQLEVEFVYRLVKNLLEVGNVGTFVANNGIVIDRSMTALDLGVVGWSSGASDEMVNA